MEKKLKKITFTIIPILKEAGVVRSSIFGSFARGEATPHSDIDIAIKFREGKTLFDLMGLQKTLEDAVGKKFDIVTYKSISPLLRQIIKKDEIKIL